MDTVLIDATNHRVGRLATRVAKMLLENKNVIIVNAEKAVFLGEFKKVLEKWKSWMEIRTLTNPRKGPFHHVRPDRFLKRRIRGMLPSYWKHKRSRVVYKRLKVYIGVPEQYAKASKILIKDAMIDPMSGKYKFVYLEDLCRELGWKP
ncbi:MAG: 50S ribosomal protein L13, partial [Candidatus Njordarchaeota archaeon]